MKLHREAIVIDTHNDITTPMVDENFDLGTSGVNADGTLKTHTDIQRMKEGGLDAEFFAIYVGKEFVGKKAAEGGGPARRALDMIAEVREQVRRHPDTFEMASTAADIRRIARPVGVVVSNWAVTYSARAPRSLKSASSAS